MAEGVGELDEGFFEPRQEGDDPFARFAQWLADAEKSEPNDPNAMALATVDLSGMPNVRMVLLKGYDRRGFVFYTNFESVKGTELLATRRAAFVMHWKSLRRQVRVRGPVEEVSAQEADAYFESRPRASRIGAWASRQSRPLESRFAFEQEIARFTAKFGVGAVPRPPHWSGFRITPLEVEFWADRRFRLHERIRFAREGLDAPWVATRLFP